MSEESKKSVWALWLKKSEKTWLPFFSWVIEVEWKKYFITVFKNNYKQKEWQPDYVIASIKPAEEKPISETPVNNADLPF